MLRETSPPAFSVTGLLPGPLRGLADGKGVPILVKQYFKAGGKLLGVTVDPRFSNTLDALILVDLRTAPRGLLERYLGKGGVS